MVEGWEDLKLNALLQAILEDSIDEDLLSNLVILMKKEKKEALQKEPPMQLIIIEDATGKKPRLPEMKSKEERTLIGKKEQTFLNKFKKEKSPKKRGGQSS